MATLIQPRQPFGALDNTRLQALTSIKNRQNAIVLQDTFSPSGKDTTKTSTKRRFSPNSFTDDFDSENVDPNLLTSPTKKAKGFDGTPVKTPKFALVDKSLITPVNNPAKASPKRKVLSLSVPATTNTTPIAHSRGSPKHKRVGILSKGRRFSSPYRRVDPPTVGSSNGGLPFSIDAALSGTISSYKPTASAAPTPSEPLVPREQKSMPKSWFFDIYEDTPQEEAANLMEHSASCLDISSDDDSESRRQKDDEERGKENIPPPDWVSPNLRRAHSAPAAVAAVHKGIHSSKKRGEAAAKAKDGDAMSDDRVALGALDAENFYPDGLDGTSVEVVDAVPEELKKPLESTPPVPSSSDTVPAKIDTAVDEVQEQIFVLPDSPDCDIE